MNFSGFLTGKALVKKFKFSIGIQRYKHNELWIPQLELKNCSIDINDKDWELDLSGDTLSKFNVFLQNNLFGTKAWINNLVKWSIEKNLIKSHVVDVLNQMIQDKYKAIVVWNELGLKMNMEFTGDGIIQKRGVFLGVNGIFLTLDDTNPLFGKNQDDKSSNDLNDNINPNETNGLDGTLGGMGEFKTVNESNVNETTFCSANSFDDKSCFSLLNQQQQTTITKFENHQLFPEISPNPENKPKKQSLISNAGNFRGLVLGFDDFDIGSDATNDSKQVAFEKNIGSASKSDVH